MKSNSVRNSELFFLFLLHSDTTKEQKYYILLNLSKKQFQALVELLYNLTQNNHIKVSGGLKQILKQHSNLLKKITSVRSVKEYKKYIKKNYRSIYKILSKTKTVIQEIVQT
jgi:hypothetical protein